MANINDMIHFDPQEQRRPLDMGHKVVWDSFRALKNRINDVVIKLVDMEIFVEHVKKYNSQAPQKIPMSALFIKTLATAVKKFPRINYMTRGYSVIVPSQIDIGLTIATKEPLSPVAVVRNAGQKSVIELASELGDLIKETVQKEREDIASFGRLCRFLPGGFFRRALIKLVLRNQRINRANFGTIQLSAMHRTDLDFGMTSTTGTTLFVVGGMKKRPMVIEDQVVPRLTAYHMLQGNHAILSGTYAIDFFAEYQRLVRHPEEFLSE
ncbi:2-oxo acid dehydrogenase subunit E2 [candidate division CSSED10-310 bacterium]|uniref:2-oxo acid dehydrogenase subunit E2 n=1 Tax=candidate division CSSED10-310 bacterium TaxID=2855610 RepID=A0ABV6Z4Z4_UNCC1